jgi:hypothetical protein
MSMTRQEWQRLAIALLVFLGSGCSMGRAPGRRAALPTR